MIGNLESKVKERGERMRV